MKPRMFEKLKETNEFDMMKLFLDRHLPQRLSIIPDSVVGNSKYVY
jgi:hypothetical protein